MRVFIDASAWVAKAVSNDQWAPELRRVMRELRGGRIELVTTTWTLYEALAVARRRKPGATQLLFRDALANSRVVAVDPEVEQEALQRFLAWDDHGASIVDHANTLVAAQLRCQGLLSFDADFVPLAAAAGIRLLR
jgi:predicted nucleic acid-binding protein